VKRPRIKLTHVPVRSSDGVIRLGADQYDVAVEIADDDQKSVWTLLGLMDGSRDLDRIVSDMQRIWPRLEREKISGAVDRIVEAGFAEEGEIPPTTLTNSELTRYACNRHYFAWVDAKPRTTPHFHQELLKKARVTVLGLGGTGSAAAMSLVAAGVGWVRIVDGGEVEPGNLARQLMYSEDDLGRAKATRAAARLRQLNQHVEIASVVSRVNGSEAIAGLMGDCDVLILAADEPRGEIQHWTNLAALETGTPWLLSAYNGPTFVVATFVPGETACFACYLSAEAKRRAEQGRETEEILFDQGAINPVIAPAANLAGHYAALEAIYLLTDLRPQTLGRVFHQNLIVYDHARFIDVAPDPECRCNDLIQSRLLQRAGNPS
jgi:molybdopterin/thiamine biosynthesis adenylyltransferase